MRRLDATVAARPGESWVRVLGGWHPGRFRQGRGPTREELDAVSSTHPVYVQLLYEEGMLKHRRPRAGTGRRRCGGRRKGCRRRAHRAYPWPDRLRPRPRCFEKPGQAEEAASTRALISELTSRGLTGAIDPGGFGITPESYPSRTENADSHAAPSGVTVVRPGLQTFAAAGLDWAAAQPELT